MPTIQETRDALRRAMPVVDRWAYFDHAAVAPIPSPVRNAVIKWSDEATQEGNAHWPHWAKEVERSRDAAAKLLSADRTEIALIPNTTSGISLVAEGFPWKEGDNVVLPDDEFPSNLYPWVNLEDRGVEVRKLSTDRGRLDLAELKSACDARTRVVSVSWVAFGNGFRRDLAPIAEIAHARDALFFVDAIQGLGVFPLDVRTAGIDCLAADSHKWMLGPEGAGIAYFNKKSLETLAPRNVGWHSVKHAGDYTNMAADWKVAAERYEGGSQNMVGMLGMGAALRLLLELGIENIEAAVLDITEHAIERLQSAGAEIYSYRETKAGDGDCRSGIVIFEMPGRDPIEVRKQCVRQNVLLSCRQGRLRISPHAYNNADDVERLIAALG